MEYVRSLSHALYPVVSSFLVVQGSFLLSPSLLKNSSVGRRNIQLFAASCQGLGCLLTGHRLYLLVKKLKTGSEQEKKFLTKAKKVALYIGTGVLAVGALSLGFEFGAYTARTCFPNVPLSDMSAPSSPAKRSGRHSGQEMLRRLQRCEGLPPSVRFQDEYFNPYDLTGGACSAMAVRFIEQYRRFCENSKTPDDWARCVVKKAHKGLEEVTEKDRSLQAALNAITVDGTVARDPGREKMHAIVSCAGVSVEDAFPKSPIWDRVPHDYPEIHQMLKELPPGLYAVRSIRISSPWTQRMQQKMEEFGHTTVLAVSPFGQVAYFDYNSGSFVLQDRDLGERFVAKALIEDQKHWRLDCVRIYKLGPKEDKVTSITDSLPD